MSIITISRQMASLGDEIASLLASKLGWPLITRDKIFEQYIKETTNSYEFRVLTESSKAFLKENSDGTAYLDYIKNKLIELSHNQSIIIMGFGSQSMFADNFDALHFRIVAPYKTRIKRIKKMYNLNSEEADIIIKKSNKKRKKFVSTLFGTDVTDVSLYHTVFNTGLLSAEECVNSIISIYNERNERLETIRQNGDTRIINNNNNVPILKTESEIEFAKILDMYQIDWQYEPKTFPIEWDDEGNVVSAFSPDFYLTKFDTYIELTTMNQKYVTEKNRKVKKLQKLYPEVNVKIVYKKDFHSIVERFKPRED